MTRAEVAFPVEKRGSKPLGAASTAMTNVPGSPSLRQPASGKSRRKQKAGSRRQEAGGRRQFRNKRWSFASGSELNKIDCHMIRWMIPSLHCLLPPASFSLRVLQHEIEFGDAFAQTGDAHFALCLRRRDRRFDARDVVESAADVRLRDAPLLRRLDHAL